MHAPSFKSPKWPHVAPLTRGDLDAVRRSLAAHADRIGERRAADGSITLPSATVADLLLTMHHAIEALA
jgi:hypothetical protein